MVPVDREVSEDVLRLMNGFHELTKGLHGDDFEKAVTRFMERECPAISPLEDAVIRFEARGEQVRPAVKSTLVPAPKRDSGTHDLGRD